VERELIGDCFGNFIGNKTGNTVARWRYKSTNGRYVSCLTFRIEHCWSIQRWWTGTARFKVSE